MSMIDNCVITQYVKVERKMKHAPFDYVQNRGDYVGGRYITYEDNKVPWEDRKVEPQPPQPNYRMRRDRFGNAMW